MNRLPLKAHQSKEKFETKRLLQVTADKAVSVIDFPMCPGASLICCLSARTSRQIRSLFKSFASSNCSTLFPADGRRTRSTSLDRPRWFPGRRNGDPQPSDAAALRVPLSVVFSLTDRLQKWFAHRWRGRISGPVTIGSDKEHWHRKGLDGCRRVHSVVVRRGIPLPLSSAHKLR